MHAISNSRRATAGRQNTMPKSSRKPGRTAATPRADSLASLLVAEDRSAAAMASPSRSVPRSRKKLRHRSSLEFLEGGGSDDVGNGAQSADAPPANRKSAGGINARQRQKMGDRTAPVTPGSSTADGHKLEAESGQQRQMSPSSKSKLEALAKPDHIPKGDQGKEGKLIGDSRSRDTAKKEADRTSKEEAERSRSKKHATKMVDREESDHLTPKPRRETTGRRKKLSPKASYSPLDYRPVTEKNPEDTTDAASHMLESYAEQWAKSSPEKTDREQAEAGQSQRSNDGEGEDKSQELDDPSSSVVSTSSNSENDDDEEVVHDGTDNKAGRELVPFDGNNSLPSQPQRADGNLELEYGRLAFLKKELEHKMHMQKLDAEKVNPWMSHVPIAGMGTLATTNIPGGNAIGSSDSVLERSGTPTREDVAFGELAYQRMMAERHMLQSKGNLDRGEDRAGKSGGDYNEHDARYGRHYDSGNASMRTSSKPKKKKKRKRRVVETITRVIHEESEEEGSASTGDRVDHNRLLEHNPKMGEYASGRRYIGDDGIARNSQGTSNVRHSAAHERSDRSSIGSHSPVRKKRRGPSTRKTVSPRAKKQHKNSKSMAIPPSMLESLH